MKDKRARCKKYASTLDDVALDVRDDAIEKLASKGPYLASLVASKVKRMGDTDGPELRASESSQSDTKLSL